LIIELDEDAIWHRVQPIHMLWALMFLKLYIPVRAAAPMVGCHEQTYMKWVWIVVKALSEAKDVVRRNECCCLRGC